MPWTLSDRKSTRLNSSHVAISYAVFCLKKKNPDRAVRRLLNIERHYGADHAEADPEVTMMVADAAKAALLLFFVVVVLFLLITRVPPSSTLFPYTTLFR